MRGSYIPFNDGCGIVGYHYVCPECKHVTRFADCEDGCDDCAFSEAYVDPDDWHDAEMAEDHAVGVSGNRWDRVEQRGM